MIFYFSGTGNSRQVAERLSDILDEKLGFIPEEDPSSLGISGKSLGFVFPVYSWGVPPIVIDFISRLSPDFIENVKERSLKIWSVLTCGDETAMAPEMLEKALSRQGLLLSGVWSVTMPNNYVLLPGFDVDSREVERMKLHDAPGRMEEIAGKIKSGHYEVDVVRGSWAKLKTDLVYPLFRRWGIFPSKWHVYPTCVGCGICVRSCPVGNIVMRDGRPKWGNRCESCLACYHSCPRHCIAYGSMTSGKGQYMNPDK